MLATGAGGTVDLHFDIRRVDLDFNVVIQLGHHFQAGKAGLPTGVGVKGADAHQTVYTVLTLEHAIGIGALDHHGSGLDAGLVAVQHIQHFHGVAVGLGPAGVHTVEHFGPVLGLGTTGAGVEGQNGVVVIVFSVEHRHELQFVDGLFHALHCLLPLAGQRGIVFFLNHLQQGLGFLILGGQLAEALQLVFHFPHLADDLLALGLVIVEAGQRHLMFQLSQALFAGFDGKRIAQVIDGGLHSAEFCFQFVNGDHIVTPWLA